MKKLEMIKITYSNVEYLKSKNSKDDQKKGSKTNNNFYSIEKAEQNV